MYLSETGTFTLSAHEVFTLMVSEEFQRSKAERLDALEFDMEVSGGPAPTVVTRRRLGTAAMPEFIKPMIDPTITVTETERWRTAEGSGTPRGGDFEIDVRGAPISLRGTVALEPVADGTRLTFAGELRSGVPLFRSKIEQSAAQSVLATIATEFGLLDEAARAARA